MIGVFNRSHYEDVLVVRVHQLVPRKQWRARYEQINDWRERDRWDEYIAAYQDALRQCSTPEAPWTVVPADRKWFRNLAVAEALVEAMRTRRRAWQGRLAELSSQRLAKLTALRAHDETRASLSGL
jgi:polyphosphate kinase 2 (PPK2 family)